MNRKEFICYLISDNVSHYVKNDILYINEENSLKFHQLSSIPPFTTFENRGFVDLSRVEVLPSNITFNNLGYVNLENLKELPSDCQFNNKGEVSSSKLDSSTQMFNGKEINIVLFASRVLVVKETIKIKGVDVYKTNVLCGRKESPMGLYLARMGELKTIGYNYINSIANLSCYM